MIDGDVQFSSSLGGNLYQFQPFLLFLDSFLKQRVHHPSKNTVVSNMDRCAFKSSSFRATTWSCWRRTEETAENWSALN